MTVAAPCSCPRCGASDPAPSFAPLHARCGCGRGLELSLPLAAELRTPVLGAGLVTNRRWLRALQARAAGGPVVLAACEGCSRPVTVPPSTELSLSCRYCDQTSSMPIVDHVVDVLPMLRLSARTWGGGMDLCWTPEVRHAALEAPTGCPSCGAEVPAFSGTQACAHCDTALFAFTACGQRFLPGVRVEGDDEGRALGAWLPLTVALEHYAERKQLVRSSSRTTCAMIGAWFLFIPLFCVLGGAGVLLVAYLAEHGTSPKALAGGWLLLMGLPIVAFASLVAIAILVHRRRRARLKR